MSQKVNAVLFRRSLKNYEWNYKYVPANKEEQSSILYKNIEIEAYLYNLFKFYGFNLLNVKFELFQYKIIVHILFLKDLTDEKAQINKKELISKIINKFLVTVLNSYCYKKINISVKLKDLNKTFEDSIIKFKSNRLEYKKVLKKLKTLKNYPNFINLIKIVFIVISNKKSAKLLADTISYLISRQKRRHSNILTFFKKVFNILIKSKVSVILGIKIKVSGRINGFPRAKSRLLALGTLPLQSIKYNVDYYESKAYTPNGTFGVKVWICQK